ncbi:MAG: sporulation integral membrane protein YtvI [Mobilitalea sp.]
MGESKIIIYIKILINFVFIIVIALLMLLVFPRLLSFFMPFVIGWIVSLIANPLVHFLEKRVKIIRKHGSAIIIVAVIGAIVGISYLLISLLIKESIELMTDLPEITKQVGAQFTEVTKYITKLTESLPGNVQTMVEKTMHEIGSYVNDFVENLEPFSMSGAGNFAKNIAEVFLFIIVTILSAYFFTANRDELAAGLKKRLPESVTSYWHLIFDNFKAAFGGYFKAQFKIMLVLTIIMFIAFEILQVGYSFVFALGIAFLDLLPVFGTGAVLWPWAIIDMVTGNYARAVGLVVVYLICQIVKQVLQPKMVGDSIGLPPLATLVFMFTGYRIYGVFGMIIGIPIGMVVVNLYRIGMFDRIIRGFKIIAHDLNEFRKF